MKKILVNTEAIATTNNTTTIGQKAAFGLLYTVNKTGAITGATQAVLIDGLVPAAISGYKEGKKNMQDFLNTLK